jgi:hypothetical protein
VRHYAFLITIALLVPGRQLAAQSDSLAAGDRVRVTVGADSTWVEGSYVGLRDDVLFLERAGDTLRFGLDSVRLLEQELRRRFDGKKGLKGAAIGGAAGAATAVWGLSECAVGEGINGECHGQTVGKSVLFFATMTGGGALLGGALNGGGRNARLGAAIGLTVGVAAGAAVGLAAYESQDCGPESFMCLDFGPGFSAFIGGALGGAALGAVGVIVGALTPDSEWVPVSATNLRVGIAPVPGGLRLAGSFNF